jgi:hypothetical protein
VLVVKFAASGRGNCVQVGDGAGDGTPYVYARTLAGSFVLPARCPHRGGPLHLARLDESKRALICPWHGGRVSVCRLPKSGIPAVRNGNRVVAVLPHDAGTEYRVEHRPLSPDTDVNRPDTRETNGACR